jgi:hypothetical protein
MLSVTIQANPDAELARKWTIKSIPSLMGEAGIIASRLTVEGPIWKYNISFVVSGRRTYADLFLPLASEEALRDAGLKRDFSYYINTNNTLRLGVLYTFTERSSVKASYSRTNRCIQLAQNSAAGTRSISGFRQVPISNPRFLTRLRLDISGCDLTSKSGFLKPDLMKCYRPVKKTLPGFCRSLVTKNILL